MAQDAVPALPTPPLPRDHPLTRSAPGLVGMGFLALMVLACLGSLPWTLTTVPATQTAADGTLSPGTVRYNAGRPQAGRLSPWWWTPRAEEALRLNALVDPAVVQEVAQAHGTTPSEAVKALSGPVAADLRAHWPRFFLGTDVLGRDLLVRCLTGGGISLGIGIAAAGLSVLIGTLYGALSGYAGGRTDAVMMRIVDILYGLPYILLVVLLAVAVDATVDRAVASAVPEATRRREAYVEAALAQLPAERAADGAVRARLADEAMARFGTGEMSLATQNLINVFTLLIAIGGVSWLTMARVVRGQVLSLKAQPFMEAARAIGVPLRRQFSRHLLPNLVGPIIVYATLTVPQAILQESFLSFLGIGVEPPLPSWGNLAADGLVELNSYRSHWWLLLFPCVLLGLTLLALNFVGEGLREAFDPKRARR